MLKLLQRLVHYRSTTVDACGKCSSGISFSPPGGLPHAIHHHERQYLAIRANRSNIMYVFEDLRHLFGTFLAAYGEFEICTRNPRLATIYMMSQ